MTEVRYEDAAEIRTTSGWCCKTCNRFYGNDKGAEHLARWCCATSKPCETCDGRVIGKHAGYVVCDECLKKDRAERHAKRERKDWDGRTPLYSDLLDKWFWNDFDIADYCEQELILPGDVDRRLQLLLCEETVKQHFDARDFWHDDLADDQEIPDCDDINEIVNKWRDENVPVTWTPTKYAPTLESLVGVFAKNE